MQPSPRISSILQRLSRATASPWFWGFLFACGLALRLRQYFFDQSYWYDEAYCILTIRSRGFVQLLGAQPYDLISPPGYLWIMRLLYVTGGQGELLMRLPAFLAGIAALFMMVPLARLVAGPRYGVWALAFLAVCRHAVNHGCEAHPYTFDLLFAELILYFTAILVRAQSTPRENGRAHFAMLLLALAGPWCSFPLVFMLGAASLALAVHRWSKTSPRGWIWWVAINAGVGFSGAALWWFSSRHMYYPATVGQWGANGWGGFPDWNSFPKICTWALSRPVELGNYGNRDIGILLTFLAIMGVFWLVARRGSATVILLLAAPMLAMTAALLGKYPLADRTMFFLLPCLWLLAGAGIGQCEEWWERRGWTLDGLAVVFIAWDFFYLVAWLIHPDPGTDYRGAYEFITARRQQGDWIWTRPDVVYETYYGKDSKVFGNWKTIPQAVEMTEGRLWLFIGKGQLSLLQPYIAAGRHIITQQHVPGGDVVLLEPKKDAAH